VAQARAQEEQRIRSIRGKETLPSTTSGVDTGEEGDLEFTQEELARFFKFQEQQAARQRAAADEEARQREAHRQAEAQWATYHEGGPVNITRTRPPVAPPSAFVTPGPARGQTKQPAPSLERQAHVTFNQCPAPNRVPAVQNATSGGPVRNQQQSAYFLPPTSLHHPTNTSTSRSVRDLHGSVSAYATPTATRDEVIRVRSGSCTSSTTCGTLWSSSAATVYRS
jgi:hypothetical protein